MILWPPKSSMVCNAVKMDKNPDSSWRTEQVQVKKFYNNILSARNAAKGYEASSTYQSEHEFGRGCRKKKRKQNFSFNNESQKNKYRRIRPTIYSSTEDENDCPPSTIKKQFVKSPPPVQLSKSESSLKSTKCRADEDEKLMERVKSKMTQHKRKEYLNKKSSEELNLEQSKQRSTDFLEMQLSDKNSKKKFMLTNFDKDHDESQLCESFESVTCEMQDIDTGYNITPQKNYRKSFSSHISFSNTHLKSPEQSYSQVSLSNNQLESSTNSFYSQMSPCSSRQHKSPIKSYSSQLSLINDHQRKNPIAPKSPVAFGLQKIRKEKSYSSQESSQLSLSNNQLKNPTKLMKSSLQFDNHSQSSKESYRRELFSSPTKSANDNSLLNLLLKEVQEIKKKAAVERQEINMKLDRILSFHCRLSRFLMPNEKHIIRPDNMPSYPLKNDEQVKLSEEYLKNNENFRNLVGFTLIKFKTWLQRYMMTKIGSCKKVMASHDIFAEEKSSLNRPENLPLKGHQVHYFAQMKVKAKEESKVKDCEVLYAVMAAAITNTLACKYNFRGDGNQKRPFCKLLLWEVIIGAIHDKRPNVSVADLSLYAGQWLKNAPYRKQDDGSYGRRDKKFKEADEHLSS